MKKRLLSLLLVCLMAAALMVPALAYVDMGNLYVISDDMYVASLESSAENLTALSESLNFDLHVDIVNSTENYSIEEYAEIFYNQYEYGFGSGHDGSELMILIADTDSGTDLCGYALYGGGIGAELLSGPNCDGMRTALDSILTADALSYQEAGDICATAVDLYASTFSALLGNGESRAVTDETADTELLEIVDTDESAVDSGALIRDFAGLLTESEAEKLERKAQNLADTYGCDTYVLTVESLNGAERREYAKQYYLANDLGNGDWRNGILFLVAMDSREYVTITYGRDPNNTSSYGTGIYAFSDYGISQLESKVVPELSSGDYYDAFNIYLSTCESYLKKYTETGEAYDVGDAPRPILIPLLITILVPLLIAFVVCMIFQAQMKTAVAATQADNYIPRDGFQLTHSVDQYTHTTQTRRTIERSESSSGGGSSVDSGGFGGSHGGHF